MIHEQQSQGNHRLLLTLGVMVFEGFLQEARILTRAGNSSTNTYLINIFFDAKRDSRYSVTIRKPTRSFLQTANLPLKGLE